jgi:hypothetical protein
MASGLNHSVRVPASRFLTQGGGFNPGQGWGPASGLPLLSMVGLGVKARDEIQLPVGFPLPLQGRGVDDVGVQRAGCHSGGRSGFGPGLGPALLLSVRQNRF